MTKFRWYYDKDKEEVFLNKMSAKGYALKKYWCGFYKFEKCSTTEYTYRLDNLSGKSQKEQEEYLEFMLDCGAEVVQRWSDWVYLRKKGEFEVYTDVDSQITMYTRIKNSFLGAAVLMFPNLIMQIALYRMNLLTINLVAGIVALLAMIASGYQVYKCDKKIKELKSK